MADELVNGGTYTITLKPVDGTGNVGSLTTPLAAAFDSESGLSISSQQTGSDGVLSITLKNQSGAPTPATVHLTTTGASASGPLSDVETLTVDGVAGPAPAVGIQVTVTRVS